MNRDILYNLIKSVASSKPGIDLDQFADAMHLYHERYGLISKLRITNFLAQIAHETGGFKWLSELGSKRYFDKYEPNTSIGKRLGNIYSGDGAKYKGRGLIQLTGRYNYTQFREYLRNRRDVPYLDAVVYPAKVAKLDMALLAALWCWDRHNLNMLADKNHLRAITRKINGGYNGIESRRHYLEKLERACHA